MSEFAHTTGVFSGGYARIYIYIYKNVVMVNKWILNDSIYKTVQINVIQLYKEIKQILCSMDNYTKKQSKFMQHVQLHKETKQIPAVCTIIQRNKSNSCSISGLRNSSTLPLFKSRLKTHLFTTGSLQSSAPAFPPPPPANPHTNPPRECASGVF